MPELPEVHTTVTGLQKTVVGLTITDVWTNYKSNYAPYKNQIKNPNFFKKFREKVKGQKIISVERRHKNILINLKNNQTVLIHLKMTGHLLFGRYQKVISNDKFQTRLPDGQVSNNKWENEAWIPDEKENSPLWDPYNRFIRLVFILNNKKHLVLSDVRKFAKVTLLETSKAHNSQELKDIGPEPVAKDFSYKIFKERILLQPKAPIKSVLMNHNIVAGIGNIYSDEILWSSNVHPESKPEEIPEKILKTIYKNIKPILNKGIKFGGDSTSDYRDITGKPGRFQHKHNVYRKKGLPCAKKDGAIIVRKVIRGRSAHFCPKHQILY